MMKMDSHRRIFLKLLVYRLSSDLCCSAKYVASTHLVARKPGSVDIVGGKRVDGGACMCWCPRSALPAVVPLP